MPFNARKGWTVSESGGSAHAAVVCMQDVSIYAMRSGTTSDREAVASRELHVIPGMTSHTGRTQVIDPTTAVQFMI